MSMKAWPKNDKPASFEDIVAPLKAAIKFAYKMSRRNINKNIQYKGFDIGQAQFATCFHANETLSAKHLKFTLEDQGRDALEEILGIAVQLGIEQGRRINHIRSGSGGSV